MDSTVFQQLVIAVVLAIISLLSFAARGMITVGVSYLKAKLGQSNFDLLQGFVKTSVSFLEQSPVFKDLMGEEKKERAILEVTKFCSDHNLPIDHDLIDKLIEEAVHEANKDLGLIVPIVDAPAGK